MVVTMLEDIDFYRDNLKSEGVVVVKGVFDLPLIDRLREELEIAQTADLQSDIIRFDRGMVHNCMFRGNEMGQLLNHRSLNRYIMSLFCSNSIIYAYQSSSLLPNSGNYGSRVHVDSPRFIKDYITNMGVIIPLDDFTHANGATLYLPKSHILEILPESNYFYSNCSQLICSKGDLIFFNARLVHAAGVNNTNKTRHALTINLCRSYMRQRFDFCRMAEPSFMESLSDDGRRLMGYFVRVPTSLDEFYLPEDERLYRPNQG
jgi:ectoine hydroxylase-related dioxygenase (phytanoyl-CoA dioxygenase family)